MEAFTRIVMAVDDTDDVTKEMSTGKVAETIAAHLVELGGEVELEITRHQLLLDESVPYTSHNSAMAFAAWMPDAAVDELWEEASAAVTSMMAATADPGLCLARIPNSEDDALLYELMAFGRKAKEAYIPKEEAYALAQRIPWLRLEELGGDGQGVVGALAGVALRLGGNDGRFRGKWDLSRLLEGHKASITNKKRGGGNGTGGGHGRGDGSGGGRHGRHREEVPLPATPENTCLAGTMKEMLDAQLCGRALFVDVDGAPLSVATPVSAASDVKPLLYGGCLTIVTQLDGEGVAHPCSRLEIDTDHGSFADSGRTCSAFSFDNDREEFGARDEERSCPNCLYRRWTASGFTCMRQAHAAMAGEAVA